MLHNLEIYGNGVLEYPLISIALMIAPPIARLRPDSAPLSNAPPMNLIRESKIESLARAINLLLT